MMSSGLTLVAWTSGLLILLVLMRFPLVVAIGAVGALYLITADLPASTVAPLITNAIDSSILLAIPLYLLAGDLMNASGATQKIVDFASALLSRVRGRLAHTNVATSLIFAGMSGSALADAAAVGKVMIPAMARQGYGAPFAAALTASASTIGPIFPPSIPMIVYGAITGVSVGALFLGGVIPGILVALALMAYSAFAVRRMALTETREPFSARELFRATRAATLPLLTPVIILSGIFTGIMTPTEAGAVAAGYAGLIGVFVYRTLDVAKIIDCCVQSMKGTATVMILLGFAALLGWMITFEGVARDFVSATAGMDRALLILMINIVLLIIGMFMDSTAAMLVFVPLLAPLANSLGIPPVQFGIMVVVNLMIGLVTPPVGFSLYVTAKIADVPLHQVIRAALPFYLPLLTVLVAIILIPAATLWLPSIMLAR
jgi:tripartite ATP-independent transporter DctM subunit